MAKGYRKSGKMDERRIGIYLKGNLLPTMKYKIILMCFLSVASISGYSQDKFLKPDSCILMKAEQGKKLLEDCSGSRYQPLVDSFWLPNPQEFNDLQSNFYRKSQQLEDVLPYIIQYIGVYIKGEKFIYINAFPKHTIKDAIRVHKDLQFSPVVVCGGGILFWRVLFNCNLKAFDTVQTNAPM